MTFIEPNYALELSIANFLNSQNTVSGSLLSGSNITYYTGIGNSDLVTTSSVIIDCSDCTEVASFTRNYEFNTRIIVKEQASDITSGQLGVLAGAVFNEFANSNTACANFTNPALGISVWQCDLGRKVPSVEGDALVNELTVRIVGASVPMG
jgi:hypothetical protein